MYVDRDLSDLSGLSVRRVKFKGVRYTPAYVQWGVTTLYQVTCDRKRAKPGDVTGEVTAELGDTTKRPRFTKKCLEKIYIFETLHI